jgi:hypothetical protein
MQLDPPNLEIDSVGRLRTLLYLRLKNARSPLIATLAGAPFNNQALTRLKTRLVCRLDQMQTELITLRSEMHQEFDSFTGTLRQHNAPLKNLESDR